MHGFFPTDVMYNDERDGTWYMTVCSSVAFIDFFHPVDTFEFMVVLEGGGHNVFCGKDRNFSRHLFSFLSTASEIFCTHAETQK